MASILKTDPEFRSSGIVVKASLTGEVTGNIRIETGHTDFQTIRKAMQQG